MPIILLVSGSAGITGITPDEASHGHTVDFADVSGTAIIFPSDTLHGHSADSATISIVVQANDTLHGHTADVVAPTSTNVITPHECLHGHTVDATAVLGNLVPGDVGGIIVIVPSVWVRLIQPTISTAVIPVSELMEVV